MDNRESFLYPKFDFHFEQNGEIVDWDYTDLELRSLIIDEKVAIRNKKLWKLAAAVFKNDEARRLNFHRRSMRYSRR